MSRRRLVAALLVASLYGCGGGGGESGNGALPPGTPPPAPAAGAVAGTLLIAAISHADGDVNDPSAPYRANDTREQAQPIAAPVALGGYVNVAGRGPAGRSQLGGDRDDVYRATLAAGQVVELVMPSADPTLPDDARDDADLALYDASGALLDQSLGLGQVERIVVPRNGEYFIRVQAFAGAPLYRLSIGQPTPASAPAADLRLSDDFRAGELIVRMRSHTDAALSAASVDADRVVKLGLRHGLERRAGAPDRELLLAWPRDRMAVAAVAAHGLTVPDDAGFHVPPALQARLETLRLAKRLRGDPQVGSADLNRVLRPTAVPDDPGYRQQRWHYEMINLPAAWDVSRGRTDVVVAVVDTGIVRAHPDFEGQLVAGYDFVRDAGNEDGDGIDANPDDPGCVLDGGSVFHGTHVAGTVAAATGNGRGVAGVGWNVRVMPLRALDGCAGSGSSYDIAQAVRYAAGLPNDSGQLPAQRADVVNLSLGVLAACDAGSQALFAEARTRGVVVVAAAGNEATSERSHPAACDNVIAVAALDSRGQRAAYTNFGSWVDLAAPGGDLRFDVHGDGQLDGVYSTHATGGGANRQPTYRLLQGTSMAAPHVAGVIALMRSVDPALGAGAIDSLLQQGRLTRPIGSAGGGELGVGLIDAFAAVRAASGNVSPLPPDLVALPSVVNLGDVGTQAEVSLLNGGGGELVVTGWRASDPWLRVSATTAGADGLGRYAITVDRSGLADASYSGWVEFLSAAGVARVTVLLQVTSTTLTPEAGRQYVVLLRPDTRAPAGPQTAVQVRGTSTGYRIADVPAGRYLIVAGTDMNNDGAVCEDGEACGAYPVEPEPTVIEVAGGTTLGGIDFTTAFRTNVEADR